MKDPGLEQFVIAIERHLGACRGVERALSPPDFALAREWQQGGVPLAAALAAIDAAFKAQGPLSSLQPCQRFLRGQALATSRLGAPPPAREPHAPIDVSARLELLEAAIARSGHVAVFEKAGRRLRELQDITAVAREPNWSYLRSKLDELDELVESAAVEALSGREADALSAEAARAAGRQLERVSDDVLAEARSRYLRRRARERFGLPRTGGD